jgi:hypothetical protein
MMVGNGKRLFTLPAKFKEYTMTATQNLLQQALAMPSAERAWLAHCLIASIEQQADENVEAAWLKLAQERAEQIQRGEVQTVTWESIKQNIRSRHV